MRYKLLDVVRNLYSNRKVTQTQEEIEKATGINSQKLKRIINGKCKNPPVDDVQLLYEYFTKTPLITVITSDMMKRRS